MRTSGFLALATALTLIVMTWTVFIGEGIDAYYRSRLSDMVQGTAWRPYVTRALVPGLARVGAAAFPAGFQSPLGDADHLAVEVIMGVSLLGFAFALRDLFAAVFAAKPHKGSPDDRRSLGGSLTALIALAFIPMFLGPFSRQIYDFTTLWLFTLALLCLARARWAAFAVVFALASVNKETSVLLTLVFVVHYAFNRNLMPAPAFGRLLAYQVVVFVAIRAGLALVFRDNPGGSVEMHLFDHNQHVLEHPIEMSKRLPFLAATGLFGAWGWQRKPPLIRHALLVLAPVLLIMGLTVGQLDEIRAYYEIYPVIVLLAAESVCRLAGAPTDVAHA